MPIDCSVLQWISLPVSRITFHLQFYSSSQQQILNGHQITGISIRTWIWEFSRWQIINVVRICHQQSTELVTCSSTAFRAQDTITLHMNAKNAPEKLPIIICCYTLARNLSPTCFLLDHQPLKHFLSFLCVG